MKTQIKRANDTKFRKKDLIGWLVMLPTLILFAFFVWEPLVENVILSFSTAKGFEITGFAGFDNYVKAFNSPDFAAAFENTFKYIFWSLLIGFLVPIFLGIIISEATRFRGFFRVGVYFPNIVPGLATVWIWSYFYSSANTGVLNIFLSWFGLEPIDWISNPNLTIPLIIISMTWKSAGSTALIYMANISGISPDLYEAATIDGAGIWKRIWHITLPSVFGIAKTMLILQIITVFQILYEPLVMTKGGPNNASISIMMLMYRYAFETYDFPTGAAVSVFICIILIIISGFYMKLTKKKEY